MTHVFTYCPLGWKQSRKTFALLYVTIAWVFLGEMVTRRREIHSCGFFCLFVCFDGELCVTYFEGGSGHGMEVCALIFNFLLVQYLVLFISTLICF